MPTPIYVHVTSDDIARAFTEFRPWMPDLNGAAGKPFGTPAQPLTSKTFSSYAADAKDIVDTFVIHFTAGGGVPPNDGKSVFDWFQSGKVEASAHSAIGRDGSIYFILPPTAKAWHAGQSQMPAAVDPSRRTGVNGFSYGVEICNFGPLVKRGDQFLTHSKGAYSLDRYPTPLWPATHVNNHKDWTGKPYEYWEPFTWEQIVSLARMFVELKQGPLPKLRYVVGHDEIAPGRKSDPGPAFPMRAFREWADSLNLSRVSFHAKPVDPIEPADRPDFVDDEEQPNEIEVAKLPVSADDLTLSHIDPNCIRPNFFNDDTKIKYRTLRTGDQIIRVMYLRDAPDFIVTDTYFVNNTYLNSVDFSDKNILTCPPDSFVWNRAPDVVRFFAERYQFVFEPHLRPIKLLNETPPKSEATDGVKSFFLSDIGAVLWDEGLFELKVKNAQVDKTARDAAVSILRGFNDGNQSFLKDNLICWYFYVPVS